MHAVGTLMSAASLYIVLIVAIYRVFFDYRLALFAAVAGCVLYAGFAGLEVAGWLAIAPIFPYAIEHPVYSDPAVAATIVQMTVFGTLLAFFAVNYGVNQSVKLHRYITEAVLRRYLPPSLVARASRGELQLDAEPERRVVTVMFSDLVGFTSLSERLGADAVGRLLNRYLSRMADVAHAHGATVDKFVGDCVMIVFGAPDALPPAEQARRCVALAKELQAMLPALGGEAALSARTGINTGEAVVGNFGSIARSDYTVIGPAVNIAARLESQSRPGRILVGDQTARLLQGAVELEPAGELTLKGVSHPVKAFFIATPAGEGGHLGSSSMTPQSR
ncbi:MAG: adenylate/guanylate cyclase domain-containing protein [Deltaproteobacteria bacterium]|nr:adenylate/guanylate cyclase domain-containing protein [Deltaproteobacteria bacterium]